MARYLGPERFGVFSYAIAFSALFGSIAKLGLDNIVVRELVKNPEKRNVILGTSFSLKLIGGIFSLVGVGVVLTATGSDATTSLYVMIITAGLLFQSFEVIDFYFQSRVLSKFVSLCRMTQLALSSLLKLYFIYTKADLLCFVAVTLVDQVTIAGTLYWAYLSQGQGSFFRHFNRKVAASLLHDSYPLIICGVLLMIQSRVDQVILKDLIGNRELGYYSSALKLIESFGFVPVILCNSLFPAIVNSRQTSRNLYHLRLLRLYRLMMALFLVVAVPLFFFGSAIVLLLYKGAYAPAGPLLSLMSMRLLFTNYGMARNAFLTAENLTGYAMVSMAAGAGTNVALNFLLIPRYHSAGAIWASVGSFFVATFLIDLIYSPTRKNCAMMLKSMLLVVS